VLDAAAAVQVRAATGPPTGDGMVTVTVAGDTRATADERCVRLRSSTGRARGVLRTRGRAHVSLIAEEGATLTVRLLGEGRLSARPPATDTTTTLALDHPDFPMEVSAPSPTFAVCGDRITVT
jgi:hypothetical protein